jgi:hypothetical protein
MFSGNKKYKWLTFTLKYGEDDYVKIPSVVLSANIHVKLSQNSE